MRKSIMMLFAIAFCFSLVLQTNAAIPNIDNSNYRIALSFDGNDHDKDDILAAPMALALIGEACLHDKLVHVDYSNHIWGDIAQSVTRMNASLNGAISRWNHDASVIFEVRVPNKLNQARTNFKNAVQAANNGNYQIYYACGGPMHVPFLCVTEAPQNQRGKVTCISHSKWNDNHKHGNSKTWSNLAGTGVKTVGRNNIGNQNDTDFNASENAWKWLDNMGGIYSWLFSRNFKNSFDASDAGMTWYIITGRGDKNAKMANIKDFFQQYNCNAPATYTISASKTGAGTISPSGNTQVDEGDNITYTITPNCPEVSISSVVVDGVNQGAISSYTFTNVTADHSISATFTGTCQSNIVITVNSIRTDCNASGKARNVINFSVSGSSATPTVNRGTVIADGANWKVKEVNVPYSTTINYVISVEGESITVPVTSVNSNCQSGTPTYSIVASVGSGDGSISPSGTTTVDEGGNVTYTIAADNCGAAISSVVVDGVDQGAISTYTFSNVTANHTIVANFTDCPSLIDIDITSVVTDCNAGGKARNVIYFTVTGSTATPTVNKGTILNDGGGNYRVREVNVAFGSTTNYVISVEGESVSQSVTAVSSCPKAAVESSIANHEVYPNPAYDNVSISLGSVSNVAIYNMQGQVVYSVNNVEGLLNISTEELGSKGLYFLNINGETQKLLVK